MGKKRYATVHIAISVGHMQGRQIMNYAKEYLRCTEVKYCHVYE
jgi:hypothetical protein